MAETLRSLAGARFSALDVITARHESIPPEDAVLDRYVFLPHARTGIAAALNKPFDWDGPTRATVELEVPVVDDRGPLPAAMTVHVHGPADVVEIDPRQVVRTFPKVDAADAEVDDLVHVEFDRPDLPWLFTPAGPDANGRLVPWVTLVVTLRRHLEWGEQRGATRRATIRRDQLQPLGDAWAWAHAQVMGARAAGPPLEQRLGQENAAHNLSRLLCPRRLDDHRQYVACVVPTFLAGAQAGLGHTPTTTLDPAWGAADDPMGMVELPVYYSWSFTTGEDGNFESLARKIDPAVAPPGVGRRRVDATRPWPGRTLGADDPGAEIVVIGPVVSPQDPAREPDERWPDDAQQRWDPAVTEELVARLNLADLQAHIPEPGPPLVGPPLYGANHARQSRIEPAAGPAWFQTLNTDPRHRVVAGLGTRVVQAEQSDLMVAAWNQFAGVEAANRALRMAQLARHVSASLHRRHLARLGDAAVVSVTERVHAKVLDAPLRSVAVMLDSSSLPRSVTVGAFRRLTRVRGPLVRGAVRAAGQRALAVESLTVAPDRLTTDWVRRYANPDGIGGVGALARAMVTDEVAMRVSGQDREPLLGSWDDELARPVGPDHLSPDALAHAQPPAEVDLGPQLVASVLRRILMRTPSHGETESDVEAALTGAAHALLLWGLIEIAPEAGIEQVELARADVERLELNGGPLGEDPERVLVGLDELFRLAERATGAVHGHDVEVPFQEFQDNAGRLRELVVGNLRLPGATVHAGLEAVASRVVVDDPFLDVVRDRIDAPALELVAKLDPGITVPARVTARLTAGSGRLPGWVMPGWFDDLRIEPVMAHPRFAHPMYEPLHRYDRDALVPGLGLIKRPDMATVLTTNNRFVEAYLVGLNHEMGRELLWREFPTDQRGTYFSSFWTRRPELVADLHEAPWRAGELGSHVDPRLDGQIVLLVRGDLVRRYPGVVAHAVRQATDAAGTLLTDNGVPLFEPASAVSPVETLFHVHLPPNVLLVGFATTVARIMGDGERWWFTLSENPTEPRFGLDPSREDGRTRDNLVWTDFGVNAPGEFLDAMRPSDVGYPEAAPPDVRSLWGGSSAQVADLLFQLPARAAFLGATMVGKATS